MGIQVCGGVALDRALTGLRGWNLEEVLSNLASSLARCPGLWTLALMKVITNYCINKLLVTAYYC